MFSFIEYTKDVDAKKEELEKMIKSLLKTFNSVPDPRDDNISQPLPAIMAPAVADMISGARSLYAMFQWGWLQPPDIGIETDVGLKKAELQYNSQAHV